MVIQNERWTFSANIDSFGDRKKDYILGEIKLFVNYSNYSKSNQTS